MPGIIETLQQQAKDRPRRVILPEQQDPRVISAALKLKERGLAEPILLSGTDCNNVEIEIFEDQLHYRETLEAAAERLATLRARKGMTVNEAREALNNPLLLAAVLVSIGYADAGVAGSIATTADVLRAGIQGIGLAPQSAMVSSFFIMELTDGRVLSYADCGVIPEPDAEQLADIAIASSANYARLTGQQPFTALLSFSTRGSAEHASIDRIRSALAIARGKKPSLNIDGELQFDAAFVPEIASRKAADSQVAGKANVFIFPSLEAGNIAYKITERIGGAKALGPLLQGLAKPWMDLSRGCDSDDIVNVAAIASQLAD